MFRSIRWNFLSWLSLILVFVIGGFGASLFYLLRHSWLQEIDAELEGAAQVLVEKLRSRTPRRPLPRGPGGPLRRGPREFDRSPGPEESRFREMFLRDFDADEDGELSPREWENARESLARRFSRRPPVRGPSRGGGPRGFDYEQFMEQIDIPESFLRRLGEDREGAPYFVIWRGDDVILKESNRPEGLERPPHPGADSSYIRQRGTLRESVVSGPRGFLVVVGKSIARELADLQHVLVVLLGTGGIVLVIGLAGGWILAKRAIRPIEAITRTAESISASNLSGRIDIESAKSELGNLARVLNTTFDRLQSAFEQQARFTADASHELRTPVSVILAQTAMARRRERTPGEYREVVDACFTVAERMKSLVEGLLTLARNDSGDLKLRIAEVDLKRIVEECVGLLESLAAERGVDIECELESVTVRGDPDRMAQVVSNLLSNAIRYNRKGGKVTLKLEEEAGQAVLSVADSGFGIEREEVPRIFDRFYRIDTVRSARQGGTGLGLAITRAIVEAHGGTIRCASVPREGSTFTVRFPGPESAPRKKTRA